MHNITNLSGTYSNRSMNWDMRLDPCKVGTPSTMPQCPCVNHRIVAYGHIVNTLLAT